jgi:hypothetical protein
MRRTPLDLQAFEAIKKNGFAALETDGTAWLANSKPISRARLERLLELGLIRPSGDSLFPDDVPSQTFVPSEGAAP